MSNRRMLSCAAVAAAVVLAGCARQAVVSSEPGQGPTAADGGSVVGTNVLTEELGRFAAAEEAYRDAHGGFAADLGTMGFTPARGVRLDVIQGDQNGFSGIASSGESECAIFGGNVRSPRGYATTPGVAACRS